MSNFDDLYRISGAANFPIFLTTILPFIKSFSNFAVIFEKYPSSSVSKLSNDEILKHEYKKSGIYEVTGYMFNHIRHSEGF